MSLPGNDVAGLTDGTEGMDWLTCGDSNGTVGTPSEIYKLYTIIFIIPFLCMHHFIPCLKGQLTGESVGFF